MKLLLDTHILLWRLADSECFDAEALNVMDEQADALFASAASVWEVAIKWALRRGGRNDMPLSGTDFLAALEEVGIDILPIEPVHGAAVDRLAPIHSDPFDRILIAQAQCEKLTLLTADRKLEDYGDVVRLI